jgi:hypothetical protein
MLDGSGVMTRQRCEYALTGTGADPATRQGVFCEHPLADRNDLLSHQHAEQSHKRQDGLGRRTDAEASVNDANCNSGNKHGDIDSHARHAAIGCRAIVRVSQRER